MIDEAVLEELLAELADEIPVPADGAEHVVAGLVHTAQPRRHDRARFAKPLLVAAAVVACIAVGVSLLNHSSSARLASDAAPQSGLLAPADTSSKSKSADQNLTPHLAYGQPAGVGAGAGNGKTASNASNTPATDPAATPGPVDGAKIVKTGTLDLQVPHATLRTAVNRVTGVAIGLGGYVADSKTSYAGNDATAQITMRVPVDKFETAIAHLDALPDVKVLGESENGTDVTGQYVDLQAQLNAATSARDAYLAILAHAQSLGDVLTVRDRLTSAQAEVDQLQGRINLLGNQASFSALAITLAEKPPTGTAKIVPHAKAQTGLAKSWSDARHGFAVVIEWIIARSGAALILLLFALALLFGVRYLYPVVRRGLV